MKRFCIVLGLLCQFCALAKDFDPTQKNDFVAFSNGDTLWGTMIKNMAKSDGQPSGLTFLKTDGTLLKLSSYMLKNVDAYSIGLGQYVYQHISYYPEQNRPKRFYLVDRTYNDAWGIVIYQFKSISIKTNLKAGTINYKESSAVMSRDITPRKYYVFLLDGEYHRMNRDNYEELIIPYLRKHCTKMVELCSAKSNLCNTMEPYPIYVFQRLFAEFKFMNCKCSF